ncbi:MAG: M1 family peptidase, partial [Nocardioides sp.]
MTTDAYVPGHGDNSYSVRHYELELAYRPDGNRLTAQATISAVALEPTAALTLDLHALTVGKVTVNGRKPARYTHRGDRLMIRLTAPVEAGAELEVVITYLGRPRPVPGTQGEAGWEELEDGVLVASQPYGAPSWFPCNDRP